MIQPKLIAPSELVIHAWNCCLLLARLLKSRCGFLQPDGDLLHPVQQAFLDPAAFQCSYCTPEFMLSTLAMWQEHPDTEEDVAGEYLAGNLCRCGSYGNILQAVLASKTPSG